MNISGVGLVKGAPNKKNAIKLVEHLENLFVHLHLRDLRHHLDRFDHLDHLGLLVQREAGRRQRYRHPRRSTQRAARDHRVLDQSTREKCS